LANQGDFFSLHRGLYDLAFELLRAILSQAMVGPLPGCAVNGPTEPLCLWPGPADRRQFLAQGLRFGRPLPLRARGVRRREPMETK
jgi:hypothetical protein